MNIGDRVRLLRSRDEGIITQFIDQQLVEVALDGDFPVPVLRSEVVVIAPEEQKTFGSPTSSPPSQRDAPEESAAAVATRGVFLAFLPQNDQALIVHLINNTDLELPFTLGHEQRGQYHGLRTGLLAARTSLLIEQVSLQNFERWPAYVFQAFYHRTGKYPLAAPFRRTLRARAKTFFKREQEAPVLRQKGYVFQLDATEATSSPPPLDAAQLTDQLAENTGSQPHFAPKDVTSRTLSEVDLHVEVLTDRADALSNADKLALQLSTFEQTLDRAIASGLDEITFIHGVGSGRLRQELHRRLSGHPYVAYFQDARKEKFGYGATLVKIK